MPRYKVTTTEFEPARVMSVDVLRAVVMLAMIFVNDIAGVKGVPRALRHYPENGNGMTLVDVVFPAFLFVVGMSIPFAIEGRRAKGKSWAKLLGHIAMRTASLLAIGVLMVERPYDGGIGWRRGLWSLLMYAGVVGAFHSIRASATSIVARYVSLTIRILSGGLLLYLAIVFRDLSGGHIQTRWWGILGLIGWAYLWASLCYLLVRNVGPAAMVGTVALLIGVFIADRAGAFHIVRESHFPAFGKTIYPGTWVDIGTQWGTHAAIAMAGTVLGWMLLPENASTPATVKMRFAGVFAAMLALGGLLLYTSYGINKNAATPTWALVTAAITVVLWIAVYALVDVADQNAWATPVAWAGANALLIYVLAGLWYAAVSVFGLKWFSEMGAKYPDAMGRSWVVAVALSVIGAVLYRIGFRLRV
jgi:predicted acyltransferase